MMFASLSGRHWTAWEHRRTGANRTTGMCISAKLPTSHVTPTYLLYFIQICVTTGRAWPRGRSWPSWSRWRQGDTLSKNYSHVFVARIQDPLTALLIAIIVIISFPVCAASYVHTLREIKAIWVKRATKEKKVKLG